MKFRRVLTIIFAAAVLSSTLMPVYAMNTGFSTKEVTEEEREYCIKVTELTTLSTEPAKNKIFCFDVNDDGLVAIGTSNSPDAYILVYSSDGDFQYGYQFSCDGRFGVEWDGEEILIHFAKGDVAAAFDRDGNNTAVAEIETTTANTYYWNHSIFATRRDKNGLAYVMRDNMGIWGAVSSGYSQVAAMDAEGNTTVIYDCSAVYKRQIIFILSMLLIFFAVYAVVFYNQFLKRKQ